MKLFKVEPDYAVDIEDVRPGDLVYEYREGSSHWEMPRWCLVIANAVMPNLSCSMMPQRRLLFLEPKLGLFTRRYPSKGAQVLIRKYDD